jgi:hypothetical protein
VFSRNITDSLETDYYISSIIDARPEISDPQTLHTFQFFTSNYIGSATIQGSLSDGVNPHVWADLSTVQIASTDDTFFSNISGKYNYFRIKHSPNVENQGTFDRILYR